MPCTHGGWWQSRRYFTGGRSFGCFTRGRHFGEGWGVYSLSFTMKLNLLANKVFFFFFNIFFNIWKLMAPGLIQGRYLWFHQRHISSQQPVSILSLGLSLVVTRWLLQSPAPSLYPSLRRHVERQHTRWAICLIGSDFLPQESILRKCTLDAPLLFSSVMPAQAPPEADPAAGKQKGCYDLSLNAFVTKEGRKWLKGWGKKIAHT